MTSEVHQDDPSPDECEFESASIDVKRDIDKFFEKLILCNDEEEEEDDDDAEGREEVSEELDIVTKKDKDEAFVEEIHELCADFQHTVPHTFVNGLLSVLRKNTSAPFPKDARTLMKTPRNTKIYDMPPGKYCHFGLKNAIVCFLEQLHHQNYFNVESLEILVNIDGAPLATSSEKGLWIISCSENILKTVEIVGIYHGEDKPSSSNDLLRMFVDEMIELVQEGFEYQEKLHVIIFHALVCDTPAKAYVLNVKYHTGYWSCTKCTIYGDRDGKVVFPWSRHRHKLRTDKKFKKLKYIDDGVNDGYQKGHTILSDIPGFGCVTNVPLDYMHLLCLGIMLKLIMLWFNGPIKTRLSITQREMVSDRLVALKQNVPSDYSRKPRQFKKVKGIWRAHELGQFLKATGVIVLKDVLADDVFQNFLDLHVATRILTGPVTARDEDYLNYAEYLLNRFVQKFQKIYGLQYMTHNVHSLTHIVDDVRKFGPMDEYSAYRFENKIGKTKKLVRQGDKVLQQLSRRTVENRLREKNFPANNLQENLQYEGNTVVNGQIIPKFLEYKDGPLHLNCNGEKNNYVMLQNGTVCECIYFYSVSNVTNFACRYLRIIGNFYPPSYIESRFLDIHRVKGEDQTEYHHSVVDILCKMCRLPDQKNFVVMPLNHTYRE